MSEIVIVDIKHISSIDIATDKIKQYQNKQIIALTPYSFYLLDSLNLEYKTLHSYVSTEVFRDRVLSNINLIEKNLESECRGLLVDLIRYMSFIEYERTIKYILELSNVSDIIYITDIKNIEYDLTNNTSILSTLNNTNIKWILIPRIDNKILIKLNNISLKKIIAKLVGKLLNIEIHYDWENFVWLIFRYSVLTHSFKQKEKIKSACKKINLDQITLESFYKIPVENLFKKRVIQEGGVVFKTWLSSADSHFNILNRKAFFYQHGNYFYKNIILKYSEIIPADVNFVFNGYTKKLFENLGVKKVYSVGSILCNKTIKERKKEYDFLYITQGHDYMGNSQYVDFSNSLHSFDGCELYQRHKAIIELFGTKFKDKQILIRVHPVVITTGVYVPFWELSELYSNITIDVNMSMHILIEKSRYIMSDYFTSGFINRELHYKRDIILFEGAPTPLPEETVEDMKKMFILVNSVDSLSKTISNIGIITKNRKRYDNIIEYYSSKRCDTKKVVVKTIERRVKGSLGKLESVAINDVISRTCNGKQLL